MLEAASDLASPTSTALDIIPDNPDGSTHITTRMLVEVE
jgi:hypothetical protein